MSERDVGEQAATLESLRSALIELDEGGTLERTRQLLAQGIVTPHSILTACQDALRVVQDQGIVHMGGCEPVE